MKNLFKIFKTNKQKQITMKKINLLVIATNKYTIFLKNLLDSADRFFIVNHDVTFNVFTDKVEEVKEMLQMTNYYNKIRFFKVEHKPFPYTTLYRYHFFNDYKKELEDGEYNFYVDVDCIIKKEMKDDILSSITAVQHCGFINERGPYESNPKSTSYIAPNRGERYHGGGFWGFSKKQFWKFISKAIEMIDTDRKNGIIPVWHDESVLNKYLSMYPPEKVLSSSYHYPEENAHIYGKWKALGVSFECVLLLLNKNHEEIRK